MENLFALFQNLYKNIYVHTSMYMHSVDVHKYVQEVAAKAFFQQQQANDRKATILVNTFLHFSPFASPTGVSRECRQSKLNVSPRQVHVSFQIPKDKQTNKQKTIDLFTDTGAILILPTGHPIILD